MCGYVCVCWWLYEFVCAYVNFLFMMLDCCW